MKTQIADHYTRVICLRIETVSGLKIRVTEYPKDLKMSNGTIYETFVGYEFTGYSADNNFSPPVIDVGGIAGFAGIDKDEVASGVFDNARVYVFACSWSNPVEDFEEITAGFFGKTTLKDEKYIIEMMGMIDVLNQSTGLTYVPQCTNQFGSMAFGNCHKSPVIVTGTVTAVTSNFTFRDDTRTEAADFFGEGKVRFTSGDNGGLKSLEIRAHLVDGTVTTHEPFYYPIKVGDAYEMTEGCRKRMQDCKLKGNILRFKGFAYIPTTGQYVKYAGDS